MNQRCDFTAEIRTYDGFQVIILQCDDVIRLPDRSLRRLDKADVGIDAIGIERGRHRTSRGEFMREDVRLVFRTDNGVIAQVGRSTPPACAGLYERLP